MSTINWGKIDKFIIVLGVIMVLLAAMVIYAFRGIFSSFITAYEVGRDDSVLTVRVNKEKLDKVYGYVFEKDSVNLELR